MAISRKESPVKGKPPAVTGWNGDYVEDLYQQWTADPSSVEESWQYFFKGFEMAMCPRNCVASSKAHSQSQVSSLIYAYRSMGHLIAQTNPFGDNLTEYPDLEISEFGFDENDLNQVFDTGHMAGAPPRATLGEIVDLLKKTYCRHIGVQYTHIQDRSIRRWLQQEMEPIHNQPDFDLLQKRMILEQLIDAEMFESFIQTRYPGQKRFSLEGAETLIPAVHSLVELSPELGIENIVIGMAHRGRLNILANILDKSYSTIFSEFEGNFIPNSVGGDGDVKYHKGFSSDHRNRFGRSTHISLTSNPSHLEAVDPVVQGRTRAKQRRANDRTERNRILPLLIHGDAAFAGQGLVAETLNLSQLQGYRTGGTVHIIVNNQIGFTTDPSDARSTGYATDVAKFIEAPIFHVNGDDPEAMVYVTELALRFRQEFHRDIIIDMVCYRRHGHNESDEPAFTQPLLYKKIRNHPSVRKLYTERLLNEGSLSSEDAEKIANDFQAQLQRNFEFAKETKQEEVHAFDELWKGLYNPYSHEPAATGVAHETLVNIGKVINTVPEGFKLNPKIARHLPKKQEILENGGSVDWALAETLAYGSLLAEGHAVRLSGQDSQRGTFSHRHAVWHDMETHQPYTPLNHISPTQEEFCVYNSPLIEAAVLGFEYGYSITDPQMLVIWEAQFGDFANGAQVIIDQFITSSESKWQRSSGLVLLLPHGYEGQGPEHSNAYLERYLAACAQNNIQVCNLSTPAQLFHAMRRQLHRNFRRPLIIMSPKSMLRNNLAVSPVDELVNGHFEEIIDDPIDASKVKRIAFCSGKFYWDLYQKRLDEEIDDVALVRIEQFYPINEEKMSAIAEKYKDVNEIVWVQEETKNRGGWMFMRPLLQHYFGGKKIRYIGRGYAASPAAGSLKRHKKEQEHIITAAIHSELASHDITTLPEGALAI